MEKKLGEAGILAIFLAFHICAASIPSAGAVVTTGRRPLKEKMSNIKLYWHDVVSGSKPSSVCIIPPVKNYTTASGFGAVNMIDNPLTAGPAMDSKLLGRAQGLYAEASQEELSFLMAMNFVFSTGKYNQSTLTLAGRNSPLRKTREVSVIGGSGAFRFARGYALLKTVKIDAVVATVLYDIHVLHY